MVLTLYGVNRSEDREYFIIKSSYVAWNIHKLCWIFFVKLWRKLLKTRCLTYYQLHTVVDHGSLWLLWSKLTPFQIIFTSLAVLITFCKWLNTQNPEIEIRFHKKTRRFGLRLTTRILLVDLLVVWSDRILHYFTFCTTLEVQYTNSINLGQVWLPVPEKRVSVWLLEFDSIYASIYQANNIV